MLVLLTMVRQVVAFEACRSHVTKITPLTWMTSDGSVVIPFFFRWLRALHDYLAFREGKEDPVLLSRISVVSSPGGRDEEGATRRGRRSGSLARRTVPGTVSRVARESAPVKDGGSDVAKVITGWMLTVRYLQRLLIESH